MNVIRNRISGVSGILGNAVWIVIKITTNHSFPQSIIPKRIA
jgi:hypothetical protein